MPLSQIYRKSAEGSIASYDYVDIAEGTGTVIFNGFTHKEQTTLGYGLSSDELYPQSDAKSTSAATTDTSFTKIIDIDFDLAKFNLPQRIKGTARATFTHGGQGTGTANTNAEDYVIIKIRKWDGTTETEIANAQSATVTIPAQTETLETHNIQIDIDNVQLFKKGDILRATVEVWAKRTSSNNRNIDFHHDPQDSTDKSAVGGDTVTFKVYIPFVLDI